jgi:hypothetical protein
MEHWNTGLMEYWNVYGFSVQVSDVSFCAFFPDPPPAENPTPAIFLRKS